MIIHSVDVQLLLRDALTSFVNARCDGITDDLDAMRHTVSLYVLNRYGLQTPVYWRRRKESEVLARCLAALRILNGEADLNEAFIRVEIQ